MKRIALLVALVLGAAVASAFVGTASAKAFTEPTAEWLAPSCASSSAVDAPLDLITDDIIEDENDCQFDTTGTVVCIDNVTLTIWTDDDPEDIALGESDLTDMLSAIVENGDTAAMGACAAAPKVRPAARFGYCSVAGDTWPNGTPIAPGTFLDLLLGQPGTDKHYTGAVPAWYVQGIGLTCSLTPAQAALAAASTLRAGGGGDLEKPIPGIPEYAFYPYVPAK